MLNPQTEDAVRRFQVASNLSVRGNFDDARTEAAWGVTVRAMPIRILFRTRLEVLRIQELPARLYVLSMNVWRSASHKALIGILAVSAAAFGQSGGQQPLSDEGSSEKVTNPIALLTRVTVENKYSPSMWDIRDSENQVEGQLVPPFKAFARQNLTRVKIFFQTSSSDGTHGLSECEIFDLLIYERASGDFGVGLSADLTAESSNPLGTVAPGPAVGVVFKHKTWRYGIFNQNFLSDTFAQTELQPILSHAFNDKWSSEIGDPVHLRLEKASR